MTHAYSKLYLAQAEETLAYMFDYAVNTLGFGLNEFACYFSEASVSKHFAHGNPAFIAGRSGTELCFMTLEETGLAVPEHKEGEYPMFRSEEYWTGYVLAYYQWRTAFSFSEIFSFLSAEKLRFMYNPCHEMDILAIAERIDEIYKEAHPETRLKTLRLSREFSQKELSERSGIPLRTLQQYEQRQKNINKASAETLLKLSRALYANIEELMEKADW